MTWEGWAGITRACITAMFYLFAAVCAWIMWTERDNIEPWSLLLLLPAAAFVGLGSAVLFGWRLA